MNLASHGAGGYTKANVVGAAADSGGGDRDRQPCPRKPGANRSQRRFREGIQPRCWARKLVARRLKRHRAIPAPECSLARERIPLRVPGTQLEADATASQRDLADPQIRERGQFRDKAVLHRAEASGTPLPNPLNTAPPQRTLGQERPHSSETKNTCFSGFFPRVPPWHAKRVQRRCSLLARARLVVESAGFSHTPTSHPIRVSPRGRHPAEVTSGLQIKCAHPFWRHPQSMVIFPQTPWLDREQGCSASSAAQPRLASRSDQALPRTPHMGFLRLTRRFPLRSDIPPQESTQDYRTGGAHRRTQAPRAAYPAHDTSDVTFGTPLVRSRRYRGAMGGSHLRQARSLPPVAASRLVTQPRSGFTDDAARVAAAAIQPGTRQPCAGRRERFPACRSPWSETDCTAPAAAPQVQQRSAWYSERDEHRDADGRRSRSPRTTDYRDFATISLSAVTAACWHFTSANATSCVDFASIDEFACRTWSPTRHGRSGSPSPTEHLTGPEGVMATTTRAAHHTA